MTDGWAPLEQPPPGAPRRSDGGSGERPAEEQVTAPHPAGWVQPGSAQPDPGHGTQAPPPYGYAMPPQPPAPPQPPYGYGTQAQPPYGYGAPQPPYGGYGQWGWAPQPPLPKAGTARTGPLPLHPMAVGDILDGAFKLYKANFKTVVFIVACFSVPPQLLAAFLQRDTFGGNGIISILSDPSLAESTSQTGSSGQLVSTLISLLASLLVLPFVAGAISRVVAASYLGEELRAGPALRVVGRRWWALVAAWVLVHLAELVGFLFCIVPGVLVMGLFVVTAPAIAVEELGPVAGMRRSARLVRPRFWPVLGTALLAGIITSILGSMLSTPFSVPAVLIGYRWGWILLGIGSVLNALLTQPLVAIVSTLLYFDARIRHEGFDLQLMAAEMAREPHGT